MRVVVFLEAVEIEHQDAEALVVARGARDLDVDALAEGAEVRQRGQVVGAGVQAQLVGHSIEGHAERRDLVVSRHRRARGEVALGDAVRGAGELFERAHHFAQRHLHCGEAEHDDDPGYGERGRHQRARAERPGHGEQRDGERARQKQHARAEMEAPAHD